jgi:hypothetical protein
MEGIQPALASDIVGQSDEQLQDLLIRSTRLTPPINLIDTGHGVTMISVWD